MNALSHKICYGVTEEDDARERAIAERIEKDADRVRELVSDGIGIGVDDPCTDDAWASDVLIALRELGSVFDRLTHGDTLADAIKTPDQMQHFRTLLRCAKTADAWIAAQIKEAAELEAAP